MLLKFYKNIITLIIILITLGYFAKFMSNTGYADILQNSQKNTADITNLFNVDNYVKLTEKSLNTTEKILSSDVLSGNLSSVDNSSLEEINRSINEFNNTLSTIMNLSK